MGRRGGDSEQCSCRDELLGGGFRARAYGLTVIASRGATAVEDAELARSSWVAVGGALDVVTWDAFGMRTGSPASVLGCYWCQCHFMAPWVWCRGRRARSWTDRIARACRGRPVELRSRHHRSGTS